MLPMAVPPPPPALIPSYQTIPEQVVSESREEPMASGHSRVRSSYTQPEEDETARLREKV